MMPLPQQCADNGPLNLSGYALPIGGKWSSSKNPGAVVNGYATIGGPTGLGLGKHYLTYTNTDPTTKCTKKDSATLLINDIPHITMPNDVVMCSTNGRIELTASPAGGVWSGATQKDQARLQSTPDGKTYFKPDTLST